MAQIDDEGREHAIAYASRALDKHEKNYCVTDLEGLAVVWGVEYFRHYLWGREFDVVTDHEAWKSIFEDKVLSHGRRARWVIKMSAHQMKVHFRPGKEHAHADCLSRDSVNVVQEPSVEGVFQEQTSTLHTRVMLTEEDRPGIKLAQRLDPQFAGIINYTEEQILPESATEAKQITAEAENFTLDPDGMLWRTTPSTAIRARDEPRWRLAVPVPYQNKILRENHNHITAGHLGTSKTYARLVEGYFWFGMHRLVSEWINMCVHCAARKGSPKKNAFNTVSIPVSHPWQIVGADILGPLSKTINGNKYIITFTDHFTKWVEGFPMPDIKAERVADLYVEHIVCRHGTPEALLTDKGSNFVGQVMTRVNQLLQVKHKQTTAYHPNTNGLTEQFNKTLVDMLNMYTSAHQRDWDVSLQQVLFAYRTSVHTATKEKPFFLTYGRDARMPHTMDLSDTPIPEVDVATFKNDLIGRMHQAMQEVRMYNDWLRQEREFKLNQGRTAHTFKEGDLVWLYTYSRKPGYSNKFKKPWQGPFWIHQLLTPLTVKLYYATGRPLKAVVNVTRLKRYATPAPPEQDLDLDVFDDDLLETDLVPEPDAELIRKIEPATVPAKKKNQTKRKKPVDEDEEDEEEDELAEEYEVQDILDCRNVKGAHEYRIHWKNYDVTESTWEKAEDVHAEQKVVEFHKERQLLCAQCGFRAFSKAGMRTHSKSHIQM